MTSLVRRLRKLEAQLCFSSPDRPRETLRVVVSSVCTPANLETSTCKRMLRGNGLLTEVVQLDGSDEWLSKEELDRFVTSFRVQILGSGSAAW